MNTFFTLLHSLYEKYQFSSHQIFNVDETGITTCLKKMSKIVVYCGKKQIGRITSGERGILTTIILYMKAARNYMPPHFIIPRQRAAIDILDGSPLGSFVSFHPSGWIQTFIFND